MAARELRYTWFNELITEHGFDLLATAHHLNDSIETSLLNIVRGSGLEGWDGISEVNEKMIRPLLFASRSQIENYAADQMITWREDSSNLSDDYQRNFVRHQIVPLLSQLNPSFENSFSHSMEKISAAVELMELGMTEWKKIFTSEKNDSIYILKDGFHSSRFPEGLLWNLLRDFGFNFDQCLQVIQSLHAQSGKIFYAGYYQLTIDRNHLILSSRQGETNEVLIYEGQATAQLGTKTLQLQKANLSDVTKESRAAFLNADKLKFPLTWRAWSEGDYFFPLGMQHKKKISDFLIDQKIPVNLKDSVTVLESDGQIVWVVGMRIDDGYKIDADTKSCLKIFIST
jgi:tRNA(Ile)-lysidine synthase